MERTSTSFVEVEASVDSKRVSEAAFTVRRGRVFEVEAMRNRAALRLICKTGRTEGREETTRCDRISEWHSTETTVITLQY